MSKVKKGYKQTEVGVIPEDWAVKQLKDISPSQSVGLVINPSTYYDPNGSVPMLVGSDVAMNKIHWKSANRISEASNKKIPASQLKSGDLVTVRVGAPGVTAVVPAEIDGCNCASMMIIRRSSSFDSVWLCYVMNSDRGLSQVEHVQYGTAQKQFNISDAINFTYAVPNLAEQTAIATALSDADALIESLEQLIAKKRNIKQGAMQELLTGKKRLPGFGGGWEWKSIEQLEKDGFLRLSRGKVISKSDIENNPGDYPIYSSSVHNDGLFGSYGEFMFDEELITWSVDGGGHFFYRKPHRFSVTNVCGFMRVDRKLCCEFVAFQLQLLHGSKSYDYMSKAHPSVIRKAYTLGLPSHKEQTAIAAILSDMDAEIAALEEKLYKARAVKQGMMQELLTGRVRLV